MVTHAQTLCKLRTKMLVPLVRLTVGSAAGAEKTLVGLAAAPLSFICFPKHLSEDVCMIGEAIILDDARHNLTDRGRTKSALRSQ